MYEDLKKQTKLVYAERGQDTLYLAKSTPSIAEGKVSVYGLFLEVGDTFIAHSLGVLSNEAVSFWFMHFSVCVCVCMYIFYFNFKMFAWTYFFSLWETMSFEQNPLILPHFRKQWAKSRRSLGGILHSNEKSHIFMDASQLHIESWSKQRAQCLKLYANQYISWNKNDRMLITSLKLS